MCYRDIKIVCDLTHQYSVYISLIDNWDLLKYPFTREKNTNILCGIQDGKLYKSLMEPGKFLSVPENLALQMYVDGVPVFKSSGKQQSY